MSYVDAPSEQSVLIQSVNVSNLQTPIAKRPSSN